jgi:hypothetical protein
VTVTTTALLTLVGRNLPALSFLSARHIVSPLKVKQKNTPPNREKKCSFVKGWALSFNTKLKALKSFENVIMYVMRAGPQLGVDACGVRRYGSVMPVCMQPVATLTLQTFAKVFLGRRFILSTFL